MMRLITVPTLLLLTLACTRDPAENQDGNREILLSIWERVDENYPFFELKGIDWDAQRVNYLDRLESVSSNDGFFALCNELFFELEDGHAELATADRLVSYNYVGDSLSPVDFSLIYDTYFDRLPAGSGRLRYGSIADTVGYLRYPTFGDAPDLGPPVDFFRQLAVHRLIIDVRRNGGGDIGNAVRLLERLIDRPAVLGFQVWKDGPARDAFTERLPLTADPHPNRYVPARVVILIDRGSYSATSILAGAAKTLPGFTVVGQTTGGGGGGTQSYELANGWVMGIPHGYFLMTNGQHIELGVRPDRWVVNTDDDLAAGRDRMLERALTD